MNRKIENETRARISAFLPEAIQKALESYKSFLSTADTKDAKEFKAHHDACKVAVAHIELLIKLAKWAELPDPALTDAAEAEILNAWIDSAMEEIKKARE